MVLIWNNDTFLIFQRLENKTIALIWEFGDGQIEQGETKGKALILEYQG